MIVEERRDGARAAAAPVATAMDLNTMTGRVTGFGSATEVPYTVREFDRSTGKIETFVETIKRGAFGPALRRGRPLLLWQHGHDLTGNVPIGKMLDVRENEDGLYFEADLFRSPQTDLLWQAIEAGQINRCSFAFHAEADRWSKDRRSRDVLSISTVPEISLVRMPANPAAVFTARQSLAKMARRRLARPSSTSSSSPMTRKDMQRIALGVLFDDADRKARGDQLRRQARGDVLRRPTTSSSNGRNRR